MTTILRPLLAVLSLLTATGALAQEQKPDPKFHIYLCFGQSNMEGGARPEAQDAGEVDPRFQMLAAVDMPHFAKVATAWFQWQLKGDTQAAAMFEGNPCGVAKMPGWKVEKKNIR